VLPPVAAPGPATFHISLYPDPLCATSPTAPIQKGSVTVSAVAPSLFTANQTGKGPAEAQFVSNLLSGGVKNTFACTGMVTLVCTPVPLDVSSGTTSLVLYGTGIRNRTSLSSVTVSVGGQTIPAFYAGPAPGYQDLGLDQVNIALPPTLAGLGTVYLTVSVGSAVSNPVSVCFTSPENSPALCSVTAP